jgi:hypothetical protein
VFVVVVVFVLPGIFVTAVPEQHAISVTAIPTSSAILISWFRNFVTAGAISLRPVHVIFVTAVPEQPTIFVTAIPTPSAL